jgi:hypothetical protein
MNSPLQFIADTGYLYQNSLFLSVDIKGDLVLRLTEAFCKLNSPMNAKQSETIKMLPISY